MTLRIAEGVVFNRVGDELVLLDLDRGVYYGLNPIGARVWQLLAEGIEEGELAGRLSEEYDADPATIAADVEALLADLRGCGLLVG